MKARRLQIAQLDQKLYPFSMANSVTRPSDGWLKAIRTVLGMSLEQLGDKLKISRQSIHSLEQREAEGAITLKSLEEAGRAMDMKLVYGFVPVDGSIEKMIEKKAKALATAVVMRTSSTMKLEDQENSPERIKKAIEERTKELMDLIPKALWA